MPKRLSFALVLAAAIVGIVALAVAWREAIRPPARRPSAGASGTRGALPNATARYPAPSTGATSAATTANDPGHETAGTESGETPEEEPSKEPEYVTVRGTVLSADGTPRAASVHAWRKNDDGRWLESASATAGPDGRFELVLLREATWHLHAEAGPLASPSLELSSPSDQQEVKLQLAGAGRVHGIVSLPDGTPAAGVGVVIRAGFDLDDKIYGDDHDYAVATDAAGAYRMSLPRGTWLIAAERAGYAPARALVHVVDGGDVQQDLQFPAKGLRLSGRVLDPEGNPVEGATVGAILQFPPRDTPAYPRDWTCKSAADGTWALADLLEGKHIVTASADGFLPASRADVEPEAGGIDLVLKRGGRMEGVVVRVSDGEPVPDAYVTAHRPGERAYIKGQFSGKDGRFVLDGLPDGTLVLAASARGYCDGRTDGVDLAPNGSVTGLRLEMTPGGNVHVHVVSAGSREPLPNVRVELRRRGQYEKNTDTGPDGIARFENLRPGEVVLLITPTDRPEVEWTVLVVEGRSIEEEVLVGVGGRIEGRVQDAAGRPIHGVWMTLDHGPWASQKVQTDGEGRYAIPGVTPGTYRVAAYDGDLEAPLRGMDHGSPVTVREGETVTADVTFPAGVRVWGVVRAGRDPSTIDDFELVAADSSRLWFSSPIASDGRYAFESVPPGKYVLDIGSLEMDVVVPEGVPEFRFDVDTPPGALSGRVLDAATRRPVEGAWVLVYPAADIRSGTARDSVGDMMGSNGLGTFLVTGIPAGEYEAHVEADDLETVVIGPFHLAEGERHELGDVFLDAGAAIEGSILDAARRPVAGARLSLTDHRTGAEEWVIGVSPRSDELGHYRIRGVRAGEYDVAVLAEGHAFARSVVRIGGPGTYRVDFDLGVAGEVRLRVVDADGAPVQYAQVRFLDEAGSPVGLPWGSTDITGLCRETRLGRGRYTGEVTSGTRRATFAAEVVERQVVEETVTLPR